MEMLRRAWDILRPRPEGIEIPPNLFSVGSLVSPSLVGKPQWTNAGTRTFDEEGYRKLSLIFRCVGLTANSLGSASMRVYDDNKNGMEVESHPFRQLMKRPNPMMGESRFLSMIGMRATVSGFCVVEKERSAAGRVVALWPMRSDWVKPIPRSQAAPDWEVRIPRIPRPIKLPAEDVIVFTYADRPDGSPTGIGPLETALREVDLLNAMTDFVKAFFDRGATPVFGLIPDLEPGYRPTQKEIDELKARWITRNLGIRNAVEPAVMVGIKDVKRLSFDFSELAYTDLRDISDIAITTAFGVKPGLVGARIGIERNTMSNAEEDRRAFYEDVISPLWGRLDDAFTLDLLPEFPNYEGLDIRFDTSKIAALQEDRNAKATWVVQATLGGAMTVHAMHRELGLPVPDGDDFFLRGLTQQVIPASDPLSGSLARESELELLGGRGPLALSAGKADRRETYTRVAKSNQTRYLKIARAHRPRLAKFFREQTKRIAASFKSPVGVPASANGHSEGYSLHDIDWQAEEQQLGRLITDLHLDNGREAYAAINEQLDSAIDWDLANPHIRSVVDKLSSRIPDINQTTMQEVARVVVAGQTEGKSLEEIGQDLINLGEGWSKGRAESIANTQSQVSYNSASALGYRETGMVDRSLLLDNPEHDDDPLPPTNTTCAQRNGMVVPLEEVDDYIESAHVNCILAVSPVLVGEEI